MALVQRPFGWRPLGGAQRRLGASVKLTPVVLVIGFMAAVAALVQLVQTSDAATSNFAIQRLEKEKLELETRVSELEAQIGALASLPRVEREARNRLGLVPPVEQRSLSVNVALPEEELGLPSRFAPKVEPEAPDSGESWWHDLIDLLPFR